MGAVGRLNNQQCYTKNFVMKPKNQQCRPSPIKGLWTARRTVNNPTGAVARTKPRWCRKRPNSDSWDSSLPADWHRGKGQPGGGTWSGHAVTPRLWSCTNGNNNEDFLRTVSLLVQKRMLILGWCERMSGSSLSPQLNPTRACNEHLIAPRQTTQQSEDSDREVGWNIRREAWERQGTQERSNNNKRKTRHLPPSLSTVINHFQKGGPYQEFLASSARVGHYWPFYFTSVLVLTKYARTWWPDLATPRLDSFQVLYILFTLSGFWGI